MDDISNMGMKKITKRLVSEERQLQNCDNSTFDPSSLCLKQTIYSMRINLTKSRNVKREMERNMSTAHSYMKQCTTLLCL